ncbi:hypothetical protein MHYP_G00342200 [Metynnis hypsauchen]
MSTLLELKSSVLRQVQRSQSLRSRREPPPTAAAGPPTPTRVPDRVALGVAKGNGEFFERMHKIIQKQESLLAATHAEVSIGFAGDCTPHRAPAALRVVPQGGEWEKGDLGAIESFVCRQKDEAGYRGCRFSRHKLLLVAFALSYTHTESKRLI